MKINLFDVDKFIKVNDLKEISNPMYFNKGNIPTEDGIFSYEIFGRPGSSDRKNTFAYIDLQDYFIHPVIYKNMIRLNRKFESCISGFEYFIITKDGVLEKSTEEEGNTGINFLYKNWDKLSWKKNDATMRTERIDLLNSLNKNEIFIKKWLIIPPFYRDINYTSSGAGIISHDRINDIYCKIIRLTKSLSEANLTGLDYVNNMTKSSIQSYLVELYDTLIGYTKKKTGIFRQAVMGKSIDNSVRNVISAAEYSNTNHYKDMKTSMEYSAVPLATTINIFAPFIIKWLQDFFERELVNNNNIQVYDDKTNTLRSVKISKNAIDDYDYDTIKRKINMFTKAPEERFETLPFKTEEGIKYMVFAGRETLDKPVKFDSKIANRKLTWTDLFYLAAVDVVKNRHVYITRYPLEDYFGIYPSKVNVLSTFKTKGMYVGSQYYQYYPDIDLSKPKNLISGLFIDSLQVYNSFLQGLGGDFDGDMVTIRGVFTNEANEEAEKLIRSKRNILTITGKNNRPISMEAIQTLYELTK